MISRTASMSQPNPRSATRKSSVRAPARASGIVPEKPKILQRFGVSKRYVGTGGTLQCPTQVLRQRRAQLHDVTGGRMSEAKPGRVQEVSPGRQRQQAPPTTAALVVASPPRLPHCPP